MHSGGWSLFVCHHRYILVDLEVARFSVAGLCRTVKARASAASGAAADWRRALVGAFHTLLAVCKMGPWTLFE